MTKAHFEDLRSHLWHYAVKNFVFQPLLPCGEWNQFCSRVINADFNPGSWPVLNLQTATARQVMAFWLKGDENNRPVALAVIQLLQDADNVRFLRRRQARKPQDHEILAWVRTCTNVFVDGVQQGTKPPSQEFWVSAVKLSQFLRELESGSESFWEYFEEII